MGRRVHTESPIYRSGVRRRRVSAAAPLGWIVGVVAAFILLVALVGVAFAGSSTTLAEGTTIAGIDVGGMAEGEATRMLGAKSRSLEQSPVSFTAAGRSFGSRPRNWEFGPTGRPLYARRLPPATALVRCGASAACASASSALMSSRA